MPAFMTEAAHEYSEYFKEESQAKICIKLADDRLLDAHGLIRFLKEDRLTLELVGEEPGDDMSAEPGGDVFITFWTGWSQCRCNAVLLQKIYGRRVFLRLSGPVIEKQTREYFRLDVSIPVSYSIPEEQLLPSVHEEWSLTRKLLEELAAPVMVPCPDGFKVVRWCDQENISPHQINLSAGGLRFKTREYVQPESLVAVNLFLPLFPPRVIPSVAETLRCSEIMLAREKGQSFMTAIRFHFISDKDRETIIAFLFAEQRRILNSYAGKR
jgi:hypothetical protein